MPWLDREKKRAQLRAYYAAHREEKAAYFRRMRREHPERERARHIINREIREGRLERGSCEICGAVAEAHHDDYMEPLDVTWLCKSHHGKLHAEEKYGQPD
jgi:hypothetical protein